MKLKSKHHHIIWYFDSCQLHQLCFFKLWLFSYLVTFFYSARILWQCWRYLSHLWYLFEILTCMSYFQGCKELSLENMKSAKLILWCICLSCNNSVTRVLQQWADKTKNMKLICASDASSSSELLQQWILAHLSSALYSNCILSEDIWQKILVTDLNKYRFIRGYPGPEGLPGARVWNFRQFCVSQAWGFEKKHGS